MTDLDINVTDESLLLWAQLIAEDCHQSHSYINPTCTLLLCLSKDPLSFNHIVTSITNIFYFKMILFNMFCYVVNFLCYDFALFACIYQAMTTFSMVMKQFICGKSWVTKAAIEVNLLKFWSLFLFMLHQELFMTSNEFTLVTFQLQVQIIQAMSIQHVYLKLDSKNEAYFHNYFT